MADVHAILVGEYIVALGVSSWAAIKSGQAPWPPTVIKTGIAFGILGIASFGSPELAAMLGAGFLLAQIIKVLNKQPPYTGGVPALEGHSALFGSDRRTVLAWTPLPTQ